MRNTRTSPADTHIITLLPPGRPPRYKGLHRPTEAGEVSDFHIIIAMVLALVLAGVLLLATLSRFGVNPMDFNPFRLNPFN